MLPTVLVTLLALIPIWRIFRRAGLSSTLSLLTFFPFLGWLAVALILARSEWPALQQAARAKEG
jgi:hypothetical protein